MRTFLGTCMLFVLLCSCSNPLSTLPPVKHFGTFEETVASLDSPGKVAAWLSDFAEYDLDYNLSWGNFEPDQAYSLAYSLWVEYHGGKSRGVCGQFAALFVVCAREHGYKCGGICMYTKNSGHAQGWIKEADGSISITDNRQYQYKRYNSEEEMKEAYHSMWLSQYAWGFFMDDKFNTEY